MALCQVNRDWFVAVAASPFFVFFFKPLFGFASLDFAQVFP